MSSVMFSDMIAPCPPTLPPSDPAPPFLIRPFSQGMLSVASFGWHLDSTAQQIYQSLIEILGTLPPETVSCLSLPSLWVQPSHTAHGLCTCLMLGMQNKSSPARTEQFGCGEGIHRRVQPGSECLPHLCGCAGYPRCLLPPGVLWPLTYTRQL